MNYNFDPEFLPFLEIIPKLDLNDMPAARALTDQVKFISEGIDTSDLDIDDRQIPGTANNPEICIRVYQPKNKTENTPALLYIHGGGFVLGSVDIEHGMSATLAAELGIVVVSVEYRLAPEHPYPAGLEDCYATLSWMHEQSDDLGIDATRIAVFGQSGGGGLSAALALYARDKGGPLLCFQCLIIPELDDRLETASAQFADTPGWDRPNAILSWDFYLGSSYQRGADDVPYHAAPARATNLSGLPPAYLCTMEFDPLRDEGIAYGAKMLQDGVQVELHNYPGTFHGSSLIMQAGVSQRAMQEMIVALKRGLGLEA